MKKILFFLLISTAVFAQPYNGTVIRGVSYSVNAGNSSTTNLASGAFFTGTISNVTNGEPEIQISISCDQPLEVTLEQFNDAAGLEQLPDIHFGVEPTSSTHNRGGLNQNLNLVGNYFRMVVKNVGNATTSVFSLKVTTGFMPIGARNYTSPPLGTDEGMGVRPIPQVNWRTTFSKVLASNWDNDFWSTIRLGSGMAISQSSGNGVITAGTTANSETIVRSKKNFTGSFLVRAQTLLSQRIINQNFVVELTDVIGDNLTLTAISATSCSVTIPNNPFTSENVGQSLNIGAISAGTIPGTIVPGRYAIASVAGNVVTFTVAGWTGATSGTGTCSLFGWNYHQLIYSGTTATNVLYDAARKGWASGATTATINTTASPGHMALIGSDDGSAFLADQLVASSTTLPITTRASRVVNIADEYTDLWLQIRVVNGSTAPASGTTWTIGTIAVENYATQQVTLANSKAMGSGTAASVRVENVHAVTATNATAANFNAQVIGLAANSAASSGNPVLSGAAVMAATPDLTLVAGDAMRLGGTTAGQLVTKDDAPTEQEFTFSGSITNSTTAVVFKNAAGASIRNFVKGIVVSNSTLGSATELVVRDGAVTASSVASNVITSGTHDLKIGDQIVFSSIGSFTGIVAGTPYWVLTVPSTTTFTLSATPNGSTLTVGGTGSPVFNRILLRQNIDVTASKPYLIPLPVALRGAQNVTMDIQAVTAVTGTIYYSILGYTSF